MQQSYDVGLATGLRPRDPGSRQRQKGQHAHKMAPGSWRTPRAKMRVRLVGRAKRHMQGAAARDRKQDAVEVPLIDVSSEYA